MQLRAVSTALFPLGTTLDCDIYDESADKLFGSGVLITEQLHEDLRRRKLANVNVAPDQALRLQAFWSKNSSRTILPDREVIISPLVTAHSRILDGDLEKLLVHQATPSGPAFSREVNRPKDCHYGRELKRQLVTQHEQQVQHLEALHSVIVRGGSEEVPALREMVAALLAAAQLDFDAFVCLAVNPSGENYPGRHSLHTAQLALALGVTLGLDKDQLHSLAFGCLIHDLGMAEIEPRLLSAKKHLNSSEFCEITRHPLRTFDLIADQLEAIPPAAQLVAYQLHERFDGSGYPRRRVGDQIHKLARIAAVADTYVAIVATRPHRVGMLPYSAVTKIVKDAAGGKYDPDVVRALLNTIALFPLGSCVELSNRMVGRVIRSNGENYDTPIVEAWTAGKITEEGKIFNLMNEDQVRIMRMLDQLT